MLEKAIPVLSRYALEQVFRVQAAPGEINGGLVEVSGEDFDAPFEQLRAQQIGQEHSQRIGFLAGSAACSPEAQDMIACTGLGDQPRQNFALQVSESVGVAEELGHIDEKCLHQFANFLGIHPQVFQVVVHAAVVGYRHTAANAPQDGRSLVGAEVHVGLPAYLLEYT